MTDAVRPDEGRDPHRWIRTIGGAVIGALIGWVFAVVAEANVPMTLAAVGAGCFVSALLAWVSASAWADVFQGILELMGSV